MSQTPEHDITDADEPADRAITPEPLGSAAGTAAGSPDVDGPEDDPERTTFRGIASAPPTVRAAEPAPEPVPEPTAVLPIASEPTAVLPATASAQQTGSFPAHPPHQPQPVYPGAPQQQPMPPQFGNQPYGQPVPSQLPAPHFPPPQQQQQSPMQPMAQPQPQHQPMPPQFPPAPPQFPPAQSGPQGAYFGTPAGPSAPTTPGVPPNWATPTASGLPPYGGPGMPGDQAADPAEPKKSGNGRIILAAAVVAALVGGAVGAGVTYALKNNSSSTSLNSANNNSASSSLNANSANATAVTQVAAKIVPSVVTITVAASDGSGDSGTGIIISSGGQILTNNHVIAAAQGTGASLTVTFNSGKITQAKILGADPSSDLAVIQAAGVSGLTPATLGDSSTVAVGEQVVAIGEPLGLTNTVTSGIVSALNRPVAPESDDPDATTTSTAVLDAIQTDAPINPGNSGGPLVNLQGQVIGIDSAIASDSSSGGSGSSQAGSIGLGFAIPINQAKPIAQELIKTGTATHSLLGVSVQDPGASATHTGATVTAVTSGGAAGGSGIKTGDIITAVDNQQIADAESLVAAIRSYQPGTTVTLTYLRGSQTMTAKVTLSTAGASGS